MESRTFIELEIDITKIKKKKKKGNSFNQLLEDLPIDILFHILDYVASRKNGLRNILQLKQANRFFDMRVSEYLNKDLNLPRLTGYKNTFFRQLDDLYLAQKLEFFFIINTSIDEYKSNINAALKEFESKRAERKELKRLLTHVWPDKLPPVINIPLNVIVIDLVIMLLAMLPLMGTSNPSSMLLALKQLFYPNDVAYGTNQEESAAKNMPTDPHDAVVFSISVIILTLTLLLAIKLLIEAIHYVSDKKNLNKALNFHLNTLIKAINSPTTSSTALSLVQSILAFHDYLNIHADKFILAKNKGKLAEVKNEFNKKIDVGFFKKISEGVDIAQNRSSLYSVP